MMKLFDALSRIWLCNETAPGWETFSQDYRGVAGSFGTNFNQSTMGLTKEYMMTDNDESMIEDFWAAL